MTGLQRVERKDPLLWPVVHIEFTVLSEDRPTLLGHVFSSVCVYVCVFSFFCKKGEEKLCQDSVGKVSQR